MTRAVLVALAVILAGCAASPALTDEPVSIEPPGFLVARVPIDCPGGACYEPTIAADREGRLFAMNVQPYGVLAMSQDGRSWATRELPPVPPGISPAHHNDATLTTSPSGRLYFHAMVIRETPPPTAIVGGTIGFRLYYEGLHVAWSDDGGATWAETYLTALIDPESAVIQMDRQWLAFGPEGEAYLTWFQQPSGHWIIRSDDGGATWSAPTRVAGAEQGHLGNHGPPVVDAEGRVHLPKCVFATGTLYVLTSEDGGATFARREVASGGCLWFPTLDILTDGTLAAAWHDNGDGGLNTGGRILVAASRDGGATWSAPTVWGERSHTGPWPLARADGALDLVWYEEVEEGAGSRAVLSRGDPDGAPDGRFELPLFAHGAGAPQSTDFAHAARLPDGRVALTWAEPGSIWVAIEHAGG